MPDYQGSMAMKNCDEYKQVIQQIIKNFEMPDSVIHYFNDLAYLCENNFGKYIEYAQQHEGSASDTGLGYAYAKLGDKDRARQAIENIKSNKENGGTKDYWMTLSPIYSAMGENNKAMDFLEKAYEDHDYKLPMIKYRYYFQDLRSNSRYKALLKKMNLPED